jgi:hypothetical protein
LFKTYAALALIRYGLRGAQKRALKQSASPDEIGALWPRSMCQVSMRNDQIARAKDIVRVIASAHVGGYDVLANAETREMLDPVIGDATMVYAVTRHFAALTAVFAQWLAHELGTPSTIDVVAIIDDVLADLEVSATLAHGRACRR